MSFRDEMQALMAGYIAAYKNRDAARCAGIYAEDADIHSSFGPPIRGRDAIADAHAEWFAFGEKNKRIDVLDCGSAGDLGYCLVRYSADVDDGVGTARKEAGTNLCVLMRTAGGWRICQSSMNEDQIARDTGP